MGLNTEFMAETFFLALSGIPVTLKLTFVSILAAAPIAFFMALITIYQVKGIRHLTALYVSFIRGTPMVLQILLVYSMLPGLLNQLITGLGLDFNIFDLNPIWYAYTVFTLNTIAVLAELFRSALLTVNAGQLEAAHAVGMTSFRGYTRIVIPQALTAALPNMCNVTINLVKSTSLAFLMTVKDITAIAKVEAAYGYHYIEAYMDIFFIYVIVCTVIQIVFKLLEKYFGSYRLRSAKS